MNEIPLHESWSAYSLLAKPGYLLTDAQIDEVLSTNNLTYEDVVSVYKYSRTNTEMIPAPKEMINLSKLVCSAYNQINKILDYNANLPR